MRYFFHIGYNGFNYRGWQRAPQTEGHNVQGIIEAQLSKIFKADIGIVGCGRTDKKVHAGQFFFHLDLDTAWDFDLVFRLNKNLPNDIAVFDVIAMDGAPHARFDAVERTYNYFIHTFKDPYLATISSLYREKQLRVDEMKKAVVLLPKYDDYKPFSKNVPTYRTTICKVTRAHIYVDKTGDNFRFEISANRFINGMVRIIVNKLLMIGRDELSVDEFEQYLISKQPPAENKPAYPQGLHLSQVTYPFLQVPARSELLNSLIAENRWKEA